VAAGFLSPSRTASHRTKFHVMVDSVSLQLGTIESSIHLSGGHRHCDRKSVDRIVSASAQELRRGRVAAVIQAFCIAAALVLGAVIAWAAASDGGKEREQGVFHFWEWSNRRKA
jgi:hypothetical protein